MLELRNVVHSYPGTSRAALQDIAPLALAQMRAVHAQHQRTERGAGNVAGVCQQSWRLPLHEFPVLERNVRHLVQRVEPHEDIGHRRAGRGGRGRRRGRRSRIATGADLRLKEATIAAGEDLALQRRDFGFKLADPLLEVGQLDPRRADAVPSTKGVLGGSL